MFAVRFEPLTVRVCVAEAVPAQAENALNVPVSVTEGAEPTVTVTVSVSWQPFAAVPVTV
jgi:hypothetical protein